MATTIPQRELRNNNAAIIDAVANGASFIVTRRGEPIAELRPIAASRDAFVPKSVLRGFIGVGPKIDLASLREDIDAFMDSDLVAE